MTPRLRRLYAPQRRCTDCGRPIVWAITVANENGRGGKAMPLDPVESPEGNAAVPAHPSGRLTVRVLKADERPIEGVELRAMPHFATCPKVLPAPAELPMNVIRFPGVDARRRRNERPRR